VTSLYLYDDAHAREFEPFALTRPVSELMAGADLIRKRWERACGATASGFIGAPHLAHFDETGAPRCVGPDDLIPAGSLIANSRFVPAIGSGIGGTGTHPEDFSAFHCGDEVCAVRIREPVRASVLAGGLLPLAALSHGADSCTTPGRWLSAVWDLIGQLVDQLTEDIPSIASTMSLTRAESAAVLGKFGVFCETGAHIEPLVVLDVTSGPILIRKGATISSFSRIVGPCHIGENAIVVGDAIRSSSIGDTCKVRGEISNSVMLGYANKGHTGFVGHSYLGRWVNLGAGTTTSNLKNTYGQVQMWTPRGLQDTGAQFLGTMFGDHVKTGIGSMLTTGSVIGAGANVYGGRVPSRDVPPFAWGDREPYDKYEPAKFIEVARRMMGRRHVDLSSEAAQQLWDAWTSSERQAQ
jgi:UDP-N-acetylglucosamine diphosphorylase / glucose-1-phosphate thymidylyltransferase / UDP-N-acetylgalactosamine diphosphorylase / glucosamine-1-phosphate N-acetyltransferase / galactosamine-1-phosphate N-acetyltransferase